MNNLIKSIILSASALAFCACGNVSEVGQAYNRFPEFDQGGKIAIVAHRGFWQCEAAGNSQNSIAALREAQNNGCWGSEFDVQLTSDDVVIVNHDDRIDGKLIWDTPYADFKSFRLPNGEGVSTLDEYLTQGEKCRTTMLVLEIKPQKNAEREDILIDKSIELLKAHNLYNPKRVLFISFSRHASEVLARKCPQFVNQHLTAHSPIDVASWKVNGIDFYYSNFTSHKDWIKTARTLGMSVNAWTVNKEQNIREMIEAGVDAITTNDPLLVRKLLGDRELKQVK